ncbi:MAG: hypothetical protein ABI134_30010, partial [Byssovorax sp.]
MIDSTSAAAFVATCRHIGSLSMTSGVEEQHLALWLHTAPARESAYLSSGVRSGIEIGAAV